MNSTLAKILPFLFLSFLFSCETTDDAPTEIASVDIEEIRAIATSGTWMVAKYEEDGIDETSNFSGYGFSFDSDGVLNVSNQSTSLSGAWSIRSDSDSSDNDSSNENDVDFNIFFTSPNDFEEISEDWEIVSYSSARIELKHISKGDGSVDVLVFEK